MTWEIALVLAVIGLTIVLLFLEIMRPAYTLFMGMVILLIFGVLTPENVLNGFSNKQLANIVLLLVIGNILKKSSIIDSIFKVLFKQNDSPKVFLAKMIASVGPLSAFFNNTPLVAMMMPYIYRWSRENKLSISKFLIPLSFASILGGCITLIGTSTLMIVNGLAIDHGQQSLGIFDFTIVGFPMLIIGGLYLIFFSDKLLPSSKDNIENLIDNSRKFFIETVIESQSSLIGKSIEENGLRNLKGLFLVEIMRNKEYIRPVSSKEILREGDTLFFAGEISAIEELTKPGMGLSLPKSSGLEEVDQQNIVEIVISHNSKLAGQLVKETNFRGKYDGAILAIHRNGERVWGQLGKVELKTGDVLLVMTGKDFMQRIENNPGFYVISKKRTESEPSFKRILLLLLGMFAAVALATTGYVDLFVSLLILVSLSIVLKVSNPKELINSIDFNLIVIIVGGLALGKAMTNSETDVIISNWILGLSKGFGPTIILLIMFFVTNVLSSLVTTQAAVAVTLPISLQLSTLIGAPAAPFIMIIGFAGAANFMTPIGYQTNLMVYGPGGYKFKDFFRIGTPLTIIYMFVCVYMLTYVYNL